MKIAAITLTLLLLGSACSVQKIALKTTSGLFAYGIEALYAEPDLPIAEIAIASNLKLIEGFHLADPKNKAILEILTQGFAAYSLAFLEESEPQRASLFYLRSRDYGFKLLSHTSAFKNGIPEQEADFKEALLRLKTKDVGALFWTAFAWSGWINLNRNAPQAVFDLGVVKAMMDRVIELDEGFFFGAAHLFWGSIDGSIPRMLGGNPDKAKAHFDRAIELSDGKFLIAYVYYAQYYAVTTLNEALFDQLLQQVADAPQDILPGFELMTSMAKKRAASLMMRRDDLL